VAKLETAMVTYTYLGTGVWLKLRVDVAEIDYGSA
jgi:hypothetical protein